MATPPPWLAAGSTSLAGKETMAASSTICGVLTLKSVGSPLVIGVCQSTDRSLPVVKAGMPSWTPVATTAVAPPKRTGHTSVTFGDVIYM